MNEVITIIIVLMSVKVEWEDQSLDQLVCVCASCDEGAFDLAKNSTCFSTVHVKGVYDIYLISSRSCHLCYKLHNSLQLNS